MIDALPRLRSPSVPLLAAAGCAALALRRPGLGSLVVLTAVGLAGLLAPAPHDRFRGRAVWAAAVALGVGAFAVAAWRADFPALVAAPLPLAAGVLAGVAEEAFFRRFLYGWLSRRGAIAAIAVTAVAFAAIHVPLYGPGVIALDLAAGVLLGWQRWATGGWSAPAVTHAAANVLAYL